jgi:uncharacterized protein YqeY
MDLNERLSEDQKSAMKAGDQARVGVLRLLRTRIKEAAVQRRHEAIDLFEQGGRGDLAARDKEEMGILEAYLPPKLTTDELKTHALEAIKEVNAITPRDLGKVMKVLMPKVTGRTEGSVVSKMVKELLAEQKD